MSKFIKIFVSYFTTLCCGFLIALCLECGIDVLLGIGIILSAFLSICSGIAAYDDIKNDAIEDVTYLGGK